MIQTDTYKGYEFILDSVFPSPASPERRGGRGKEKMNEKK